jgi:PAS domain S-box-containing protein
VTSEPSATTDRRAPIPSEGDDLRNSDFRGLVDRARAHAFENLFDAVVVTDLDGRIVDWNAGSERLYGYPREEALGRPVSILHVPEDSDHLAAEVIAEVQRSGRWQGEIRMLHREGHVGWIESMVVPLFDDRGEPVGALGINRDISARREAEESLRAAESRFRSLVEHSLVGICIIQDQRFLYVNPKFTEIFAIPRGVSPGEIRVEDLVDEEDWPMVRENLRRRLAGEKLEDKYSFRGRRRDGQTIHVEVFGTRIEFDGAGAVIKMVQDVTEQRRAEERLRASQERLSGIISHAMEAIIAVDTDQRIVVFNEAAEQTFRCAAAEALGTPLDRFIPERFREAHRNHVSLFGRTGKTNRSMGSPGILCGLRADGEEFPMEAMISRAGDGHQQICTVILRDVSERLRAETALRESEERLRLVVRATNDVVWEWDIPTSEVRWSESAHRSFRYAPEEMGDSIEWWSERIHPQERERVVTGLHRLIEGVGDSWSDEYRFLRGDGSYATLLDRGYLRRDERGAALKVIGALMDITERRRTEDAQRLLARASAHLESSLDVRLILPGLIDLIVPGFADLARIDLLEEDGTMRCTAGAPPGPAMERFPSGDGHPRPGDAADVDALSWAVNAGKPILISAGSGRSMQRGGESGRLLDLLRGVGARAVVMVPLRTHERVLGALTLGMVQKGRDFGPRDLVLAEDLARRTADALENARLYAEAQRAVRAREEMLRIVSHDLRNPLGTVRLSAEALGDPETRGEDHAKWLAMISQATGEMERMIGDLMDAARIDTGGLSVDPLDHPLSALVTEVEDLYGPLAAEKGIRMECPAVEGSTIVRIDAPQIHRVLANLIGNSIKFTPRGGTIRVDTIATGEEVRVSIADSGPGIAAEELPHVFDRYWQARRGDRRGVGLGLAIAEGIVTAHGGRIWAESGPEGGAVFHFTLPRSPGKSRGPR